MNTGEIASIVTIAGTALTFLGVSGIDSMVVSQFVTGIFAAVTLISAFVSHYKRPSAPANTN